MWRRSRSVRVRSGQFELVKLNAKNFDLRDTYHLILTLGWPAFAGVTLAWKRWQLSATGTCTLKLSMDT